MTKAEILKKEASELVMNELRGFFRPEFLNRLDEIILFKPLTLDNLTHITDLLIKDINRLLADRELAIELTPAAKLFVTENGYDPNFGARPLKRYLQKTVETLAAKIILEGKLKPKDVILVDVADGKLEAKAVSKEK